MFDWFENRYSDNSNAARKMVKLAIFSNVLKFPDRYGERIVLKSYTVYTIKGCEPFIVLQFPFISCSIVLELRGTQYAQRKKYIVLLSFYYSHET